MGDLETERLTLRAYGADDIDLLLFQGPATLSGHGKAVLGWALILLGPLAAWRKRITK